MRKEVPLELSMRMVNHGPVVMVVSRFGEKIDVTPIAWHMPVEKKPPVIALAIWEGHFVFKCIKRTRDFTVNILPSESVKKIVKCGSVSGRDVDKTKVFSLPLLSSKKVSSPSLKEAMGVLECEIIKDEHLLKKYNMVLGKVKYAEADERAFGERWLFAGKGFRTVHHLGDRTFVVPGGKVIDLGKKLRSK